MQKEGQWPSDSEPSQPAAQERASEPSSPRWLLSYLKGNALLSLWGLGSEAGDRVPEWLFAEEDRPRPHFDHGRHGHDGTSLGEQAANPRMWAECGPYIGCARPGPARFSGTIYCPPLFGSL